MKRIIAMVCGLALIFCVCAAFGEGTPVSGSSIRDLVTTEQQQAKPFSFRNGVSWAMNQQQVIAIENIPMKQSASSGVPTILQPAFSKSAAAFSESTVFFSHPKV